MMFTTKTEYGMRAMVALAENYGQEPLSIAQIAKREHISQSYLERIFSRLRADDLISGTRGALGGYSLNRKPKDINVFEIVEALEGALAVFQCVALGSERVTCSRDKCLTQKVWREVQKSIIHSLRKFTLADLI